MKTKLLSLISFVFIAFASQAQLNYLNSTDGGSAYEVCYYNNHLFAGCANTLEIYNLTGTNHTPGALQYKKRFLSNIDYITVKNGYLYVCVNHDGLWKFNLSPSITNPVFVAHYVPQSISESISDIAFYGDTILVAAKTKVQVLLDSANTFTYKSTVASYPGNSRVRGLDVKDSLLAYTLAYSATNSTDGVYLYNLKNLQQLDFYNSPATDPLEVSFGQNNNLLHVMGGSFASFPFVNGSYYALDYSNTSSLQLKFNDTINGQLLLGSISAPMNAKIIHDTVYISTQGGGPDNYSGGAYSCQVYVYDATNPNNIHFLTDLYAGLYHFDVDIDEATRTMYVASEWYGVLSVNVQNIYNEVSLGKTLTGGWCHGSAFAKNRLAEASEGYGVRLYDMTVMQSPQLIAEDTAVGFCRAISISDSANYVYAWELTGDRLRVFDGNTLNPVGHTSVDPNVFVISDFKQSRYHNGRIAVIEEINTNNKKIVIANVSNPALPVISHYRQKNSVEDILFHPSGLLFVCAHDSLIVFDPSDMSIVAGLQPPSGGLQQFKSFTLFNDTLYVYYSGLGEGIAKYYFNSSLQTLTYLTASVFNMNSTYRIFMASDSSHLYIGSTIDSLRAITKTAPHTVVANYNHGADHIFDNLWGLTDLYYRGGYLFLNEYMGQTSIFGEPSITTGNETAHAKNNASFIYPNPSSGQCIIHTGTTNECIVCIYDMQGKQVYSNRVKTERLELNTSAFNAGLYIVSLVSDGEINNLKLLVDKGGR